MSIRKTNAEFIRVEAEKGGSVLGLPKWKTLNYHAEQYRLWTSKHRFKVAACGRRSGKSELAKRIIARAAMACPYEDGWFIACAPTRDQAKRIFWRDLKALIPKWMIKKILEAELTIRLITGVEISVIGLDVPQRVEGRIIDGVVLDEYADMDPEAWSVNIRPALSSVGREGWALIIGTPEGRNHFYTMFEDARSGKDKDWSAYTWKSAEVISPAEIEAARRQLDPIMFRQEYEADFISFDGRAYYSYDPQCHASEILRDYYNPEKDLIIGLDFNVSPGTASIMQEHMYTGRNPRVDTQAPVTMVLGEVWIKKNSNTHRVCNKLLADWGDHQGNIIFYGDATGGNKGTQASLGSDWDIVRDIVRPVFGSRFKMRVGKANPKERARVNAVNRRLLTADGVARLLVDPKWAPMVCKDFDTVTVIEGTDGELDKDSDPTITHLSDGIGYHIEKEYPTTGRVFAIGTY